MAVDRIVSYSELDSFKQCPHKHQLAYVERWSKAKDDTTAAGRGTLWHKVMDCHYTAIKAGVAPAPEVKVLFGLMYEQGRPSETLEILEWMYAGYVDKWGDDRMWEILAIEWKAQVPLKTAAGRKSGFILKMILDLVVRDRATGKLWIVDHKSHANLPSDKELELDDQFGLYTWGLRELGKNPFGCIYNTARTQYNKGDAPGALELWKQRKAAGEKPGAAPKPQTLDQRFSRFLMARTETELDTIALEALDTARSMYSSHNRHERHTNSDTCKWRCDYTEPCLMGRKTSAARERVFLGDLGFAQSFQRH